MTPRFNSKDTVVLIVVGLGYSLGLLYVFDIMLDKQFAEVKQSPHGKECIERAE